MMGMSKKGPLALLISSEPKAKGKSKPYDEEGGDDELGLEAASEFMAAIKKGDASGVWEAFKAMKDCCGSDMMDEEGD